MADNDIEKHGGKLRFLSAWLLGIVFLVQLVFMGNSFGLQDGPQPTSEPDSGARADIEENFGKLPLYFIENQGQLDSTVGYYVKGRDKTLFFTSQGLTMVLSGKDEVASSYETGIRRVSYSSGGDQSGVTGSLRRWVVKLDFVGANPDVRPVGIELTEAVFSYFKGSRKQWKTGLKTYGSVVYRDLWPGIDLVYTGTVNRLKYRFVVRPGADPEVIRLAYRGASSVVVNDGGQLEVNTPVGEFSDDRPISYQEVKGQRVEVATAYRLQGGSAKRASIYGFKVGSYDRSMPLVVDPAVLVYCGYIGGGYFGGRSNDGGDSIAVDDDGNAYITGNTPSTEATFPVTVGPDVTFNGGLEDAFVAKVNASGTALVYCGYIGGSSYDSGSGIAVDDDGNAYITGTTCSTEATFPVTVGPDVTFNGGLEDAFVAKVNASGTALDYCGYIGGSVGDSGSGIAVDDDGNVYITGSTISTESTFPVTVGPDLTHNGSRDAFVAKVKASGTGLVYCGYIGGSVGDSGSGIAVDVDGNAYVTGFTESTEATFPVTVGPDLTHNGSRDAFVAKVNASGTTLDYCGYIGGSSYDSGSGIAVDDDGNAYITGTTCSTEATFPVTVGPDVTFNGGLEDAFVAKVNASGTTLDYCGYIGGSSRDWGLGIAVDVDGNAYVTGFTESTEATFPVTAGPDQTYNGGDYDAFVAKANASGTALDYCGYIGGSDIDSGSGIAVDVDGNAYVTGSTTSIQSTFPVTVGPDLTCNGDNDAFVAKVVETVSTIVLGLDYPQGQGYMEVVEANSPYTHLDWVRVPWPAYNAVVGGTNPCLCNLDDDPHDELVIGLDAYPTTGGYVEIRDDATTGFAHLTWLRVPWPAYNAVNGATYPTCGDFDGDGKNELAIGLGTYTTTGGYVEIREDYTTGYAHQTWVRVPWPAYNSANGETRLAAGDFDGDGKDELAIGLGEYTTTGGYVEIKDDATTGFAHMAWPRVPWPAYNSASGTTRPAAGDFDGDGKDELAIGLGTYTTTGGYVEIRDDATTGFAHMAWPRVPWPAYNSASGTTRPAAGDLDSDGKDELIIGLGTYPTKGGYVEIKDDDSTGYAHMDWMRVHWPTYNSANGETRPSLGR